MGVTAVRGFNDVLPADSGIWRRMEEEAFRVFSAYGFSEIRVPIVEKTELFLRSIGETTDIVEKEMYTFTDRRGDSLTLRPEGTAPCVRAYIEHRLYESPVQRLFYAGPMFRYERPQKGRYRQFYQIGAEVLGEKSPKADAEAMEMLMAFFNKLGIKGLGLQINSLGCAGCRPAYKERLRGFLLGVKERLCEDCLRRLSSNALRALDCKNPGCAEATAGAPAMAGALCAACAAHFDAVRGRLVASGVEARLNERMVRGLDYYTKTAFEVVAEGIGSQNAIAAGGRYDGLVKDLGGPETPCFGFALGVERVALLARDVLRPLPGPGFLIALGAEAEAKAPAIVKALRERGIGVVEDFSEGPLKSRMKRADRSGARFALILGEDELKAGVITLKDMATAEQERVAWDVLPDRLSL
jgi:histidyl-tRNA synthetase